MRTHDGGKAAVKEREPLFGGSAAQGVKVIANRLRSLGALQTRIEKKTNRDDQPNQDK